MIDFSKLLHQTPEEIERARIERDVEFAKYLNGLISSRTALVTQLAPLAAQLPAAHQSFVADLQARATRCDSTGLMGGELAELTERQAKYLEDLVARYATTPNPPPDREPSMGHVGSRAARFGQVWSHDRGG